MFAFEYMAVPVKKYHDIIINVTLTTLSMCDL